MARYVDVEVLKENFAKRLNQYDGISINVDDAAVTLALAIVDTPTADVAKVKHGHWVDDIQKITTVAGVEYNGLVGYKCSLCGRREGSKEPYCNCGAKMDGVRKEDV